jgi:hypothetical protein
LLPGRLEPLPPFLGRRLFPGPPGVRPPPVGAPLGRLEQLDPIAEGWVARPAPGEPFRQGPQTDPDGIAAEIVEDLQALTEFEMIEKALTRP